MLSQQTETSFLSVTRPNPTAQYKKLPRKYPASFNLIVSSVQLFKSGVLAAVRLPVCIFWSLWRSCPAAFQQSDHESAMCWWNGVPCAPLPGSCLRQAANQCWVLWRRFLWQIGFPSGIWPVLPCWCSEGFQQNWGVSHTMGSAWALAGVVPALLQLYNNM